MLQRVWRVFVPTPRAILAVDPQSQPVTYLLSLQAAHIHFRGNMILSKLRQSLLVLRSFRRRSRAYHATSPLSKMSLPEWDAAEYDALRPSVRLLGATSLKYALLILLVHAAVWSRDVRANQALP